MAEAHIAPISTVLAIEMTKGMNKTVTNSISRLDNEVTASSLSALKGILVPFLEYPVAEAKVKETGLLVEED